MASLVFCAFTLEAYCNHIGQNRDDWETFERLKFLEKLQIIFSEKSIPFDASRRPIQTAIKLNKLRNALSHGKSAEKIGSIYLHESARKFHLDAKIKAKWERISDFSLNDASLAIKDVEAIITMISRQYGQGDYPLDHFESVAFYS